MRVGALRGMLKVTYSGENGSLPCGPEWEDLLADSPTATPFQTPEWVESLWSSYPEGRSILQLREGRDLVGIFPVRMGRRLRQMGAGPSDYLHPLLRGGYEREGSDAIAGALMERKYLDLIDLHQIRETHPLAAAFASSQRFTQARCLVLSLPGTFDEYVGNLSKSLRYEVRRLNKEPYVSGKAKFETVREPERVPDTLAILFDLHARRWRRQFRPGAFAFSSVRKLHERFATQACRNDRLRLSVLTVDGEPVGAIYAMKTNRATFFYQSGFAPERKSLSPGTVSVAQTIRRSIEDGCTEFDFLRGDEPYKARWKPQRAYDNLRLLTPKSALGQGAAALYRCEQEIENRLRRMLER